VNRIDFDAKCSTCGRKYKDHSNDEIDECVNSIHPNYNGNIQELLVILSQERLIRKWGQPGQMKSEFAIWPLGKEPPMTSTIPTRDFAIFLLSNQNKGIISDEKGTRKEKKDSFINRKPKSKKEEKEEDKDAKEETEHIHVEE
jgi:hypothetical protein